MGKFNGLFKGEALIYGDDFIYIEQEISEIPWVKIFAKTEFKELSDCDEMTQKRLFDAMLITEKTMRKFYNPDKINIASFANYLPRVHIHVQARFKNDSFFPQSMWGIKQREGRLKLPEFSDFCKILRQNLGANLDEISSLKPASNVDPNQNLELNLTISNGLGANLKSPTTAKISTIKTSKNKKGNH